MGVSHLYPIIDFTQVDYTKIPIGAFLIGFDSSNGGKLCKMDSNGTITVIEGDGGSGTFYKFYFQANPPVPNPSTVGARWIDSDNGVEYVWVFDGTNYFWVQPTQLGKITYQTLFINTATYSASFAYEYYGVTYTGGICTITLPFGTSPDDDGQFINIADEVGGISYGNRGILVQGSDSQLINGETSVLMKLERMSLNFMFRNNSWKTI